METSEIRDKLLEQRAIYQQSLKAAEEELKAFSDIIISITDEQYDAMMRVLSDKFYDLRTIDLKRLCKDREYLDDCKTRFETMVTELHRYLEVEVNV